MAINNDPGSFDATQHFYGSLSSPRVGTHAATKVQTGTIPSARMPYRQIPAIKAGTTIGANHFQGTAGLRFIGLQILMSPTVTQDSGIRLFQQRVGTIGVWDQAKTGTAIGLVARGIILPTPQGGSYRWTNLGAGINIGGLI